LTPKFLVNTITRIDQGNDDDDEQDESDALCVKVYRDKMSEVYLLLSHMESIGSCSRPMMASSFACEYLAENLADLHHHMVVYTNKCRYTRIDRLLDLNLKDVDMWEGPLIVATRIWADIAKVRRRNSDGHVVLWRLY
jgi:hypothetical protein